MNKNYCNADGKYVTTVRLYAHSDNKLYQDAAHKIPFTANDMANLAKSCGVAPVVIVKDTTDYIPVSYSSAGVVILTGTTGSVTAVQVKFGTAAE